MAEKYEYSILLVKKSGEKFIGQYKGRWLEGLTLSRAKEYLSTVRNLRPEEKWVIGRRKITNKYEVCDDWY